MKNHSRNLHVPQIVTYILQKAFFKHALKHNDTKKEPLTSSFSRKCRSSIPQTIAYFKHALAPHNLLIILLHLIRCLESKQINTCLKHSLGQLQKTDIGFLLRLILFTEDLGLMIKAVECIGNLINICTDFMRSFFLKCTLDHTSKSTELKHQVLLAAVRCRKDLTCFKISACFHITVQDGFDTNDCIKDVRTCISLERGEAVYIKNIILGSLIGKIAIFNCCQTYNLSSISCIFIISAIRFSRRITPPSLVLNGLPSFPFIVPKPRKESLVSSSTRPVFLAQRKT